MVDKSEKFEWLIRLGYAARGLVYILVGYLLLSGAGAREGEPQGAFQFLRDVPAGALILDLAALGLLAYGLYKFLAAAADLENLGSGGKGLATRAGFVASAIAHLALAYSAFQIANGKPTDPGQQEQIAGGLLSMSLGPVVLGLVGIGFMAAALIQAKNAVTAGFMKNVAPGAPDYVRPIGRGGHAARTIVFAIIGWSLVQSGWLGSNEVKTFGEAVSSLSEHGVLFTLTALGILLFGFFSLLLARYRIIPDIDAGKIRSTLPGSRH